MKQSEKDRIVGEKQTAYDKAVTAWDKRFAALCKVSSENDKADRAERKAMNEWIKSRDIVVDETE